MKRLLRPSARNTAAVALAGSPTAGRSTTITSAPRSASTPAAKGPGAVSAKATTLTPSRGSAATSGPHTMLGAQFPAQHLAGRIDRQRFAHHQCAGDLVGGNRAATF